MSIISGGGAVVGAGGAAGGYEIERSLRFNSADSAYLNRTPASAGNRKTWTWSAWFKRSQLGTTQVVFYAYGSDADSGLFNIYFDTSDQLYIDLFTVRLRQSTQVFRDASAWYHLVVSCDTTQATAANRLKVYINGFEITAWATNNAPTQNLDTAVNNTVAHNIGRNTRNSNAWFNGYMTEINFIDGSALTPSSFGETDTETGVWKPKAYSGSYGTNGFYLNFSDNSGTTSTTLGKDSSGNGNNWTPNNFSVTAGAGNDSLVDSPTRYGTDTGAGNEVRGNYCTWNRLQTSSSITLANGNLDGSITGGLVYSGAGTIQVTTGKWYFETVVTAAFGAYPFVGVVDLTQVTSGINTSFYSDTGSGNTSGIIAHAVNTNVYLSNNTSTTDGTSYNGTSDVLMVAFDADLGKVWFGKNGTWNNSTNPATNTGGHTFSTVSGNGYRPYVQCNADTSNAWVSNFGQRPFSYAAPTGFKALVTTNLPEPTIADGEDYFNAVLYTGNGSTNAITGVGFAPDWVWLKDRSAAYNHELYDILRGTLQYMSSSTANAESTLANSLTAFGSDGFTLGSQIGGNTNGNSYVAWNWKANGSGVSNTAGTITSTVSVSTTSGFSIVTYTGNGSNGATAGHGLGVTPTFVIVKSRSLGNSWMVKQSTLASTNNLRLQTTDASTAAYGSGYVDGLTSSVITFYAGSTNIENVNASGATYVAYCFAPVAGFSSMGSYVGNGSTDGVFVYTGFRPRYILHKATSTTSQWLIWDTARNTYNVLSNAELLANQTNAEGSGSWGTQLDILSNGFKFRGSDNTNFNYTGITYIYIAFAENPFSIALAR
jgi:hypothetical protein